jgi:NADPH:quinone reductase-like Zn-dependent oxidoreductase
MMHALRAHARGGAEALVYETAPMPSLTIGDVLVRVHAASFTPTELSWPSTWIDRSGHDRAPIVPGHEVSGVVSALGYGATGFAVGDAVYGLTDWYRDGAAAEYVAVSARNLARKPATLAHADAAATTLSGLTAWQALFEHGHLAAGQTVLIHGAAGGVGTYAVQLARAAGARVVATGRAWARDLVTGLGADVFVDVEGERFEEAAPRVDIVLDVIGGEVLERSLAVLKPGGTVVSGVPLPSDLPKAYGDRRAMFFVVEPDRVQLDELARRIDAGQLRPIVGATVDLKDGPAAFAQKQRGGRPGKTILRVRSAGRLNTASTGVRMM